jgi:Flp pilus assembly pilin Flp
MIRKLTATEAARAIECGLIACCLALAVIVTVYGH